MPSRELMSSPPPWNHSKTGSSDLVLSSGRKTSALMSTFDACLNVKVAVAGGWKWEAMMDV